MKSNNAPQRFTAVLSDSTRMGCDALRLALKHFARDLTILGAANTAEELVQLVDQMNPDIALVSLEFTDGGASGIGLLRTLRAKNPQVPCVALADIRNRDIVIDAFRAGARGVLFRSEGIEQLVAALRAVHQGEIWASSAEVEQMLNALISAAPLQMVAANGDELLTDRQKSIVGLVAEGLTNREIAEQLKLSEHTVKNYLFRIFDKLGVSSRAELIIYTLHQNSTS